METVAFEPADDYTRVELAVEGKDELVTVEGRYETHDPAVIAALDAHPYVQRAVDKPSKGKADE